MYRAGQGGGSPVADSSQDPLAQSRNVGALDPTSSQLVTHGPNYTKKPVRNSDEATKTNAFPTTADGQQLRARVNAGRPLNTEPGMIQEPANAFAWGIGGGGAPTGAPEPIITNDQTHMGYDPIYGTNSDLVGIGPLVPGPYGSMAARPNDSQAHEVHLSTDFSDPRHDFGGYPLTRPQFDPSVSKVSSNPGQPAPLQNNEVMYQRPPEQFLQGRPAKKPGATWLFERPFDQFISQRFTGQRVRPTSPPDVSGSQIDQRTGPHASMPPRNNVNAPLGDDAYPGAFFAPSGMQSIAPTRNSWRLQPTPWDANLVTSQ